MKNIFKFFLLFLFFSILIISASASNINNSLKDEYIKLWSDFKNYNTFGYKSNFNYYKTNRDQGSLRTTENKTDLAIAGDGFFQVIDMEGQIYFTRNGDFVINSDRFLVNRDGCKLFPVVQLPENFKLESFIVYKDGSMKCKIFGDDNFLFSQKLQLYMFKDFSKIERIHDKYYKTDHNNVFIETENENYKYKYNIYQGFLEMSTVYIDKTIIQMIFIMEKLKKSKYESDNDYDTKIFLLKQALFKYDFCRDEILKSKGCGIYDNIIPFVELYYK